MILREEPLPVVAEHSLWT